MVTDSVWINATWKIRISLGLRHLLGKKFGIRISFKSNPWNRCSYLIMILSDYDLILFFFFIRQEGQKEKRKNVHFSNSCRFITSLLGTFKFQRARIGSLEKVSHSNLGMQVVQLDEAHMSFLTSETILCLPSIIGYFITKKIEMNGRLTDKYE